MTERVGTNPYGSYFYGNPRPESQSTEQPLGTRKTLLVLVVVVGCFAVLWPKVFYPMLVNSANSQVKPGPIDRTSGCCDVISEVDFNTIKLMSELCSTIIESTGGNDAGPKEIVAQCRKAVLETCGIDISAVLQERVSLGHSVKQILEEVRSLNGSLCLKYNFGVSPWSLGVPHRIHVNLDPAIRQERPSQLRPDMVHPAFKERGRAIPQTEASAVRRPGPPPRIVEGRPGPIPGMRPAMGGPGHVVPPSKQSNNGFLGVLMPVYTIGFVVFFGYTIMKLVFKKKHEDYSDATLYPSVDRDDYFQKEVFEGSRNYYHRSNVDSSKIVVNAVSALLEEVNNEIEARKQKAATAESVPEQEENVPTTPLVPEEDEHQKEPEEQGSVTVMGMETTASCEGGKKWSRPDSPVLPHPPPVVPKEPSPPPQQIFLEGTLPPQSQLLVSDSATEAHKDAEDDAPVVLAGKMTLSVISLDSETATEDSDGKKMDTLDDDERRTSSGGTSEEFEKINPAELEDQINSIIEEAEIIAMNEERRFILSDELEMFQEGIEKTPQIDEKSKHYDVLEEIKNQLNLEDDLLKTLSERVGEEPVELPVTDLIKEFLNKEESALLTEVIGVNDIEQEVADALIEDTKPTGDLLSEEERELIAKYQALDSEDQITTTDVDTDPQTTLSEFASKELEALLNETLENNDVNDKENKNQINLDKVEPPAEQILEKNNTTLITEDALKESPARISENIPAPADENDIDNLEKIAEPIEELSVTKDPETHASDEVAAVALSEVAQEPLIEQTSEINLENLKEVIEALSPEQIEELIKDEPSDNLIPVETVDTTKEEPIENPLTQEAEESNSYKTEITPARHDIDTPAIDRIINENPSDQIDVVAVSNDYKTEEDVSPVELSVSNQDIQEYILSSEETNTESTEIPSNECTTTQTVKEASPEDITSLPGNIQVSEQDTSKTQPPSESVKQESSPGSPELGPTENNNVKTEQSFNRETESAVDAVPTPPNENVYSANTVSIESVKEDTEGSTSGEGLDTEKDVKRLLSENGEQESRALDVSSEERKESPALDLQGECKDEEKSSNLEIEADIQDDLITSESEVSQSVETGEQQTPSDAAIPKSQAELFLQGLRVDVDEECNNDAVQDESNQLRNEEELPTDDVDELDLVEQVIEDIAYEDESDSELARTSSEELHAVGRLNGVENEISENELDNEEDIEIEEIIEYVDNTDDEGEEIIEVNVNQNEANLQNGDN